MKVALKLICGYKEDSGIQTHIFQIYIRSLQASITLRICLIHNAFITIIIMNELFMFHRLCSFLSFALGKRVRISGRPLY